MTRDTVPHPHRRHCLGLLAAAPLFGLAGCGFRLRQSAPFPFQRVAVVGLPPRSSLELELRRQWGPRLTVVERPEQAELVLHIDRAFRDRLVTGQTSSGLVRELLLRLRVSFRLSTPQGRDVLSADVMRQRDLSTNESVALAKAREEEEIFTVLEREVAQQWVRMMEALPASAVPAPSPLSLPPTLVPSARATAPR